MLPVRKIRSKNYRKIIECQVPVRFYWHRMGFDGIEIGPLPKTTTPYCVRLINELLDLVEPLIVPENKVPGAFTRAFPGE